MAVESSTKAVSAVEKSRDMPSEKAMEFLYTVVRRDVDSSNDEGIKEKEQAIQRLGELMFENKLKDDLCALVKYIRPFLSCISKAKSAKLVRNLLDLFLQLDSETTSAIELCKECIEWAKAEKRSFLRQNLESRLVALFLASSQYTAALDLGSSLLRELKKLDDKALLVDVQLLESRVYYKLGNVTKSRAALTSARTTANGIYTPPKMQAGLDLQAGILHAHDLDFKMGYSYLYESFEGFDSVNLTTSASLALKYLLLCKILQNSPEDVSALLTTKLAQKYHGEASEAMSGVATACKNRSLCELKEVLASHEKEFSSDDVVRRHLDHLYDNLLEQNLLRLVEPFSRVQVAHIAKLITLPQDVVESKLSQMILDKKVKGILDQGAGVLEVFDPSTSNQTYNSSVDTIKAMGKVVDGLYLRARKLS
ncbi:26S proteasome non-ATPase regulatory subunit 11-like [Sycon ciliatum]|uniref:26S proteasome non-ATPase regulatory subunit 11-like n=1 Tax=Sycon ciliatum TaxID=27933 RepID=UPI0020A9C6E9|eukprot:scpid8577/ scgid33216/ 26S proteasome non-ATPase regulatory subunit 11; 26S proteasome regulatory subunit RPN6; 26S proteasome regulatory subunit S9; 26S proteasome regulatory subunit p44.5